MADENFAVDIEMNSVLYIGDFSSLADNLRAIKGKLSSVLTNIYTAAEEVDSGSEHVAGSAQTLSQGAAEQSVAIEQLAQNLEIIEKQTELNSQNCNEAHRFMNNTSSYLEDVNEKMDSIINQRRHLSCKGVSFFRFCGGRTEILPHVLRTFEKGFAQKSVIRIAMM